jgi:hypothetical protein
MNTHSNRTAKTIVYQSYRSTNVPAWIELCLQTVRAWASANSFDYRFIDDQLFDYAPPWFREKAQNQICPVSDLARLIVAKELLAQGYDFTVWVDADMVVFEPERLAVNIKKDFAFCQEIWLSPDASGQAVCHYRVNNSITVFARNNVHLDFFIDSCQRIARHKPQLGKLDIGTAFLTQLSHILPFPLLTNVGMFSPAIMADIAGGREQYLKNYAQRISAPLACANLCASLLDNQSPGKSTDNRLYETVVEQCLQTKGEVINRFFDHQRRA